MRYLFACFCLLFFQNSHAQKLTLTDSLTKAFFKLWDSNDTIGIYNLLQPDGFFKSPYQLRYGRDTMKVTVLRTNPTRFKNCRSIEKYSHIDENLCYSVGTLKFSEYNKDGSYSGKEWDADYVLEFTRKSNERWKIQMVIFHEGK